MKKINISKEHSKEPLYEPCNGHIDAYLKLHQTVKFNNGDFQGCYGKVISVSIMMNWVWIDIYKTIPSKARNPIVKKYLFSMNAQRHRY